MKKYQIELLIHIIIHITIHHLNLPTEFSDLIIYQISFLFKLYTKVNIRVFFL